MPVTGARGNATWWCVLGVFCLVLLAPLTLADVPPLLDYPNHLARLFVLAFISTDPVLARFYIPHWAIIPNLGLDLTVPPLLRLFPVHLVGRIVVGVTLLLPFFGAIAYHRALHGRRSYWPFTGALFAYNAALLRGFLNFNLSIGVALLLGAAWARWRERKPLLAIILAAVGTVALFFCHLVGLLFFAILVGGHELAAFRAMSFSPRGMLRRAAIVIAIFAAPAILYAVSDLSEMQGDARFRTVAGKAGAALMPVMNYFWPLDLLTAALCVTVPVVCLAARWCTMKFEAVAATVVLLILYIALPSEFKGTNDLDTRFIVMAAFMIPASLLPVTPPRGAAWTIAALFLVLFSSRMTVLMTVWNSWAADLTRFRAVIAYVQPGDVVMTVRVPRRDQPDIWTTVATARHLSDDTFIASHLPALLLIERRAWWPFLFDNASQQPIQTREPYHTAAILVDEARDPIALLIHDTPEVRPFTHVLVLRPDSSRPTPAGLKLVFGNEEAALYAIERAEVSPPQPPSPRTDR